MLRVMVDCENAISGRRKSRLGLMTKTFALHFRCYLLTADINKWYNKNAKTEIPQANQCGLLAWEEPSSKYALPAEDGFS